MIQRMFTLHSEEALRAAFRPKDRDQLELPPGLPLPAVVHDYLAWAHPAGGRVYLVFAVPDGAPIGIVFDTNGAGASTPQMCDWCHCTGVGTEIGLLTARLDAKRRVGVNVCSDLGCKRKLEDEANRTGASAVPAIEGVVARMGRFASEALRIDLFGAGR
jgi:hypothetical protein